MCLGVIATATPSPSNAFRCRMNACTHTSKHALVLLISKLCFVSLSIPAHILNSSRSFPSLRKCKSERYTMSLRRSTRLSSASSAVTSDVEHVNGVANGVSRKKNAQAPKNQSAASKKRKAAVVTDLATDSALRMKTESSKPSNEAKGQDEPEFAVPQTPTTKRRKAQTTKPVSTPPPLTPTPSSVRPLASSSPVPLPNNMQPEARPAEPRATNAPLSTPGGSRIVAYPSSPATPTTRKRKVTIPTNPPPGLPPPTSTTDTLLADACAHLLKVDPKLKVLIDKHHCDTFSPQGLMEGVDPFISLSSTIIGQQVGLYFISVVYRLYTYTHINTHICIYTFHILPWNQSLTSNK